MKHLWLVAIDITRLRGALHGAAGNAVERALAPAASATRVRVVDACVLSFGVRALVAAPSRPALRTFVRRLIALSSASCATFALCAPVWRPRFRAAPVRPEAFEAARDFISGMRAARDEVPMSVSPSKVRGGQAVRKIVPTVRLVERAVDALLGADEAATRVRRYVAEHDAPADDRVAFGRLCVVVFSQGIGYETVLSKLDALRGAFADFDPVAVGAFSEAKVAGLITLPIIRNEAKIRACVDNARRWTQRRNDTTYLGRIASIAATDDASGGWPALVAALREDFARLGESTARQTLKRWGFFTAFAHPGARRLMERLGFLDPSIGNAAAQLLVGGVAQRLGRDPYAVEAVLALFAGAGPCKKEPACMQCALADRCPHATSLRR